MQVYLDGVFLLNGIVDLLLILGTNRLTGFPMDLKRAIPGAVLGGLYGCMCLIPELRFLNSMLWRLVFFGLMTAVAFGVNAAALRRGAILLLLSMALGGIAAGAGARDFAAVCLCAALVVALCNVGIGGHGLGRSYVPVELDWQGNTVKLLALNDTGNTLRDPLTGEQVLVCGADVGAELLNLSEKAFADPAELLTKRKIPGLRLIPYHCVGQPCGIMAVMRFKNAKIGGTVQDPLVAFAPYRIGSGEGYRMLTGGLYS